MLPTSQAAPRLRTEGGAGVALPYLDAAINVPVDCQKGPNFKSLKGKVLVNILTIRTVWVPLIEEHENFNQ